MPRTMRIPVGGWGIGTENPRTRTASFAVYDWSVWSVLAVVLSTAGVLVCYAAVELDDGPLLESPPATALAVVGAALLGAAALLTVAGLTSWHWPGIASAGLGATWVIRFVIRSVVRGLMGRLTNASGKHDPSDELGRRQVHLPRL